MQKGFITIPILIIAVLGTTLIGGGGYGAYKYSQVVKEKQMVEAELTIQKDNEIQDLKEQLALEKEVESIASSTEIMTDDEVEEKTEPEPKVREVIRTVTEYIPVEVPTKPEVEVAEVEVSPGGPSSGE